jgi:hypothetical protein
MSKQEYEYKQLSVTDLLLNLNNPRFDPVRHQKEAIYAMIEDQKDKLVILAKHIVEYGLNPTDIVLVQPQGNKWLVREGNRRITALKLANKPSLIPNTHRRLRKEFTRLSSAITSEILSNIPCVVINDERLVNEWIRLKHTGQNDGAGTVNWNAQQTSRFRLLSADKPDKYGLFLDELKQHDGIPQSYKGEFANIKKTNLDRLMGDPDARRLLGVVSRDGHYVLENGVNQYLLAVLHDLVSGSLRVGSIYYKDDRRRYLDELQQRVDAESGTQSRSGNLNEPHDQMKEQSSSNAPVGSDVIEEGTGFSNNGHEIRTPSIRRGRNYPINRKTLIPSYHRLEISHARISRIFKELKSLDADVYPNGVAVLFRVFVELSCDYYITKIELTSVTPDSTLTKKIEAIADHFKDSAIMTKSELRAARQMASSPTQTHSVQTFHSYVHNRDVTPVATDLKTAWDDLWPFTQKIWRQ